MTKMKSKILISTSVLAGLTLYNHAISADVTTPQTLTPVTQADKQQDPQAPKVINVQVSGEPNTDTVGTEVFDPVTVTVKTDHFTNDNLLTKDGLGWTDETEVQPIKGAATGTINNSRYWGQNNPTEPVTAYTFNNGDSGRITNIGQTLAGTKLDLIYTVEDSDKDDWMAYSGFGKDGRVKGLAFTGEQYIKGSSNNSIVALYNGANYIDIKYQIVRHDTFTEQPVLVSFITTDIDVGQGVATDLANLAVIIPKETNLSIKDGVIYDGSHTGPYHYGADLNGANGLPYGGYLGVAYLSKFNYTFFAPAPANDDIYKFATGVRYDLFGSALQTKLVINRQTHMTVKYIDDEGKEIQSSTNATGTNGFPQVPAAPSINGYQLVDTKTNIISPDEEEIIYQYLPEYHLTVEYLDEQGNSLSTQQELTAVKGALVQLKPVAVEGYQLPTDQSIVVSQNDTIKFIYSKQQLKTNVEYVDEQGNILGEPQEIISTYGSRITIQPVQITGFNSPNSQVVEVKDNQTVRLVYTRKSFPITVQCLDEKGKSLAEDQHLTALFDSEITLQPSEIEGYITPILQTTRITGATTVKFVYSKQAFPIQIEFIDEDGKQLQPSENLTAKYNEKLTLEPPVIEGYTGPDKQEVVVDKAQKISFAYHKIIVPISVPQQQILPQKSTPVRVVRQNNVSNTTPIVIKRQPAIVRNVVRPQPVSRPAYRSVVQTQIRPQAGIVSRNVAPKLPSVNFRIYKPSKHINKQVQKKKQTDWFEKNTGMDKKDQKVFFDVLDAIDKDGKKRGLSRQQRNLEQLYYIAGVNYAGSKPQRITSRVSKYNKKSLQKIVGGSKANSFYSIVGGSGNHHKVDLSHMAITAAGALDKNVIIKGSQSITTSPDKTRSFLSFLFAGKSLTNTHMLPNDVEQWLFTNGYYGDKIVDHNISKEDLHADLDVYSLVTGNKSSADKLWKMYNTDSKALDKRRQQQEKGMAKRTEQTRNAKVGLVTVGTVSLATLGLVAWNYARKKKLIEKAKNTVNNVKSFAKKIPIVPKMVNFAKKTISFGSRAIGKAINYAKKTVKKPVNMIRTLPKNINYAYHHPIRSVKRFVKRNIVRPVKKTYHVVRKAYHRTTNFIKKTRNKVKRFFRRRR